MWYEKPMGFSVLVGRVLAQQNSGADMQHSAAVFDNEWRNFWDKNTGNPEPAEYMPLVADVCAALTSDGGRVSVQALPEWCAGLRVLDLSIVKAPALVLRSLSMLTEPQQRVLLRSLEVLILPGTNSHSSLLDLASFAPRCERLRMLCLSGFDCVDLCRLSMFPALRHVVLRKCGIRISGGVLRESLAHVQAVEIFGCVLSRWIITFLGSFSTLSRLALVDCDTLKDDVIAPLLLGESPWNTQRELNLHIARCKPISTACLTDTRSSSPVTSLTVADCPYFVPADRDPHLFMIGRLPLTSLSILGLSDAVGPAMLYSLVHVMRTARSVFVSGSNFRRASPALEEARQHLEANSLLVDAHTIPVLVWLEYMFKR